jgi:hypothetical protein
MNALVIHPPSVPPQLRGDPPSAISGYLQRDLLDLVSQFHITLPDFLRLSMTVETRPADAG